MYIMYVKLFVEQFHQIDFEPLDFVAGSKDILIGYIWTYLPNFSITASLLSLHHIVTGSQNTKMCCTNYYD